MIDLNMERNPNPKHKLSTKRLIRESERSFNLNYGCRQMNLAEKNLHNSKAIAHLPKLPLK